MGEPPTPVESMVMTVLRKDCHETHCPYGKDDARTQLALKVKAKIKGRVSDGFEVRKLEEKNKVLMDIIQNVREWGGNINLFKEEKAVLLAILDKAK